MVGSSSQDRLDRLIDEVARGRRDLGSIRDREVRERVRVALRLHKDAPATPDPYTRMRMRARVLAGLDKRRDTAWTPRDIAWRAVDIAWTLLAQLARPAPYIVRAVGVAAVLVTAGLGMTAASAGTLPDETLYPVKLASEELRLVLATSTDDRALVELSIADHRLAEAERLAEQGRTADALIASAAYTQRVATAAADLAPTASVDLADRLERSFDAQRLRAQTLASSLSGTASSARAAAVLAIIAAPTSPPAADAVQRVAETAARAASELASAAEALDAPQPAAAPATPRTPASPTSTVAPSPSQAPAMGSLASTPTAARSAPVSDEGRGNGSTGADRRTAAPSRSTTGATPSPTGTTTSAPPAAPSPTPTATMSAPATPDRHGSAAATATRRAAEAARDAAERVRQWVAAHPGERERGHGE